MNLSADADVCSLLLRSGRIAAQQRSVTRCTTLSGYSSHPSGSENHCRHWPRFDPARMPISTSGSIPPVGWTLGRSQARPAGALSLPCHEGPARTRVEGAGPPLTNYHRLRLIGRAWVARAGDILPLARRSWSIRGVMSVLQCYVYSFSLSYVSFRSRSPR